MWSARCRRRWRRRAWRCGRCCPAIAAVLEGCEGVTPLSLLPDLFGAPARVLAARRDGLDLLLLEAPHLFDRPGGPYQGPDGGDWPDNPQRFAALAQVAARLAVDGSATTPCTRMTGRPGWRRPICASRRAGCRACSPSTTWPSRAGRRPALLDALGLPPAAFAIEGVEYCGDIGFLKAGLWYAEAITTVSPSYAEEIMTPEGGMGLDGLLRTRAASVHGILNGLDQAVWDPAADPLLAARFDAGRLEARAANKAALRTRLGLAEGDAPILAYVGRLAWQKGADLLLEAAPGVLAQGAQIALLGAGDAGPERDWREFAQGLAGVAAHIGFDEGLARLIYGGADAVVVPSRFEPCGLAQMAALRYGAPPVVARTGGLADTVIDASPVALAAACATGVQVAPGSAPALAAGLRRALRLYREPAVWRAMQARGMATDLSWAPSARRYAALLRGMAGR